MKATDSFPAADVLANRADLRRNRTPWTEDDDAELLRLRSAGNSPRLISIAIGRTQASIETRLLRLKGREPSCRNP